MIVSATISDAIRAKVLVNASGRKSLPASPVSANTGRNEITVVSQPWPFATFPAILQVDSQQLGNDIAIKRIFERGQKHVYLAVFGALHRERAAQV